MVYTEETSFLVTRVYTGTTSPMTLVSLPPVHTLLLAPDAALALEEELADLLWRGDWQPAVHDGHVRAALLEAGQLLLLLTARPLLARGRRAPT
jgi:hypothetical protein